MRKICTFLLTICTIVPLFAQQPLMDSGTQMLWNGPTSSTEIIDTLDSYLQRATGAVLRGTPAGGYVMGTGYFDNMGTLIAITNATGSHFDGVSNARVTEILTWFGSVDIIGSPDSISAQVWSINSDTTADSLLGYGMVTTADLTGSTSFVYSPIAITSGTGDTEGNPFLAVINYAQVLDDTIGIVSSSADSGDGLNEKRLRQLASVSFGSSWLSIEELWGPFDCDAFIIPVIDDAPLVNLDCPISCHGLELLGNFPNPTSNFTQIRFKLSNTENVSIKVFDLSAKEIYNSGWQMMNAGEHNVMIDVSEKPAGAYYYTIRTEKISMTSKLLRLHD